jgi:HNH endonuclease
VPQGVPTHRPRWMDAVTPKSNPKRSPEDADWAKFLRGPAWKKFSQWFRDCHPYCWMCQATGHMRPTQHVHHLRGHDVHDPFNSDFLYPLCRSCHSRVTAWERAGKTVEYPPRQPAFNDEGFHYA